MTPRPSIPRHAARVLERLDDSLLGDTFDDASAEELANIRMGVFFAYSAGFGSLFCVPIWLQIWPAWFPLAIGVLAVAVVVAPAVLRRRRAIRFVGHFALAAVAFFMVSVAWLSGGRELTQLPFLFAMPMLGLLVDARRGALVWTAISLAILAFGSTLLALEWPAADGYVPTGADERYAYTTVALLTFAAIVVGFHMLWNRTAIDVADRAQSALDERDERNRILLEYASEGVLIAGPDAQVRFASPAAERLVAVAPGELVGRRLRDFTCDEDFAETYPAFERLLTRPGHVEHIRLRTKPGFGKGDPTDVRILDLVAANHVDNPAVGGIVIRMQDVTDLAAAEANYGSLIERSLQGISVECDGRTVYVNQAMADVFGVSPAVLRDRAMENWERWVHDDDRAAVDRAWRACTGEPVEMRFRGSDGEWHWTRLNFAPATWEGRDATQIFYTDVTAERTLARRREEENERLAKAVEERTRELERSLVRLREQERLASVGTLAAGIAHQINNPIGAILTSADFALLTADEADGRETTRRALREIQTQAIRCGRIVRSVLQFSRAEQTEKWYGDVTSILRTAVDVTARFARDRDSEIELRLDPKASTRATLMNPIELEQVFVNLLRNAIECQERGGRVRVSTALLADDSIDVTIADDGPGIAAEDVRQVFDPFFTTRLRDGGTGLGLSVAMGIVDDHGGRLWLEERQDSAGTDRPSAARAPDDLRGAHFHVTLPTGKVDETA